MTDVRDFYRINTPTMIRCSEAKAKFDYGMAWLALLENKPFSSGLPSDEKTQPLKVGRQSLILKASGRSLLPGTSTMMSDDECVCPRGLVVTPEGDLFADALTGMVYRCLVHREEWKREMRVRGFSVDGL